ncbi:MAG TPA: prolyl aminopeptidase [Steroidobacteraceae bacterium]|nr:prolyl aminopeptidase [Steroidobacteraceae bacterium]
MTEAVTSGELYPAIEPYETGSLPVSDGHLLAYELCGNPDGRPVVFLHGGPGAGCTPLHRRFFDPSAYRIVLFDQRGAGRSTPSASVDANTTAHLVADIEALRRHLLIDRWVVFGGSWGSTLGLAYAAAHADACRALILRGIWLCRPIDLEWWFEGLRLVYPEYWRAFTEHIPQEERGDLLGAYLRRLLDPDPAVHVPAAVAWERYETSCERLLPPDEDASKPRANVLSMPRIEACYMRHGAFLGENELADAVPRFRHVPAIMVHGRYDMLCPVEGAVVLADAWPEAMLTIVPDAGHSAFEPGTRRALVAATDRFRNLEEQGR